MDVSEPGAVTIRAIMLALVGLVALLAGVAAGVLAWLGGTHPAHAVLRGGAAFGGTVALCLALIVPTGYF